MSDNQSESEIEGSDLSGSIKDIIVEEPLFHILGQFLINKDNQNITMVLANICNELREIKEVLKQHK